MNAADSPTVTELLSGISAGDPQATDALLPLVYDELRRLAHQRMRGEDPQTLQPTALVHEAWLRLVGSQGDWDHRGHFFAAAAEAMRRILIERARKQARQRHGGELRRTTLGDDDIATGTASADLLQLDEALSALEAFEARLAQVVKLRYFVGLSLDEVAAALDVTPRTVSRDWAAARAWLYRRMAATEQP